MLSEIEALPETGDWFYGLVRFDGKVRLREVFPGLGHAAPFLRTPWSLCQAAADVLLRS